MKHLLRPANWLLVALVVSAGIAAASGWYFWWVFVIAAIAILVNGLLAALALTDDAMGRALRNRRPEVGLMLHSDRAVACGDQAYRQRGFRHGF